MTSQTPPRSGYDIAEDAAWNTVEPRFLPSPSPEREYRVLVVVQSRIKPEFGGGKQWEQMISSADDDNPFSAYITGDEQNALEAAGAAGQAIEEYRIEQPTGAAR
jgi:hypothetical protein